MSIEIFHALVFWLPAFLFSTTVHEAAHAWAARRGGDSTAADAGLVTLSPLPHMARSPLGMVVVPVLTSFTHGVTLGWASAPFDREWADRHPRRAALMAAAGPAGNLAIAAAALLLIRIGLVVGWFEPPSQVTLDRLVDAAGAAGAAGAVANGGAADFFAHGLSVLAMLNVILAVFNLLPLPPLDGASVVTLFLPEKLARRVAEVHRAPGLSFVGLVAAWQLFPMLTRPLFALVVTLLHPGLY
ncbi:MAG: site-2 protease family protein [Candidatus Eisenbacteria bacterium]|uniref:Site-2 protease family protein n=1 Tax=Eiseniibacteriota bacterium TaxID=2212470 RepID=A0A933W8A9_UNCEI|nr:site-2 protease family protein [Candidatus Eisenbacteria bacterium]